MVAWLGLVFLLSLCSPLVTGCCFPDQLSGWAYRSYGHPVHRFYNDYKANRYITVSPDYFVTLRNYRKSFYIMFHDHKNKKRYSQANEKSPCIVTNVNENVTMDQCVTEKRYGEVGHEDQDRDMRLDLDVYYTNKDTCVPTKGRMGSLHNDMVGWGLRYDDPKDIEHQYFQDLMKSCEDQNAN